MAREGGGAVAAPASSGTPAPSLPTKRPHLRLYGQVGQSMLDEFLRQQQEAPAEGPLVLELTTSGGDADFARRIALEIRLWQEEGRELWFFGKTAVYSAGVTIMAAFPARRRVLSRDAMLLVHERRISKTVQFEGSLRSCLAQAKDLIAEIESGQLLEEGGFAALIEGSKLSLDDLRAKVYTKDLYLTAQQALQEGLVAGLA